MRVPFVVYQPGTLPAGKVNPGRIRNLDFAPTFLDLSGASKPVQFEGKSAWSLINGVLPANEWKLDDFIYEYYWEWTFPMTPGTFSITRGNLKYIQYYGIYDREELYDIASDPEEMHNLIDDAAYLEQKIALRQGLYDGLSDSAGRHVIAYSQRRAIGSVRRMEGGTDAASFPREWFVEPNRLDRADDLLPDSPEKNAAHERGEALFNLPVVGQGNNSTGGSPN